MCDRVSKAGLISAVKTLTRRPGSRKRSGSRDSSLEKPHEQEDQPGEDGDLTRPDLTPPT